MLLKDLNQAQKKVVEFGKGPLLVLAGAGSGKTRALTHRVAYLIKEKKIDPERILLVTFTNKAAGEMKTRVKKLIGNKSLPYASTFHSFCAKLLRIDGNKIGIANNFAIYDETDSLETIKQAIKNLNIDHKSIKPTAVKTTISGSKNELITAIEYLQVARGQFQETAAAIYREYQRLLNLYQALDFDDLLFETVKLLQKEPEIREKYQQKFYYVLVDEYQDTNKAQYLLTKIIASKWRNLCVVGDASQSIYSWRGANYRNLNNLQSDFPDLTVISLEQNYRSTQNILNAANQVIIKNQLHPILKLWTKQVAGKKIKIYQATDEKDEADLIIKIIKKLPTNKPANCAILYRINAQSRSIEEALIKAGIPYSLIAGTKFYSRKEIKDCLAYLRYLSNPKDVINYRRLEKLGKRRLEKFLDWTEKYQKRNNQELTTLQILEEIFKATDYLDIYDSKNEAELIRLENIKELKTVAAEFTNLTSFLENVALIEATDEKSAKGKNSQVKLMTLHASKGLEFETVFMIGMEEGLFPHSRSILDKQELEEERRLCYVGMTRAKQQLFLTYARQRLYFGIRSYNTISRFLTDIEEDLLETVISLK